MDSNNPQYIHETVLRDLVDLITDEKGDIDLPFFRQTKFNNRNIARATRDLILTFPVLVTEKTSIQTASLISRAIERKAVALLQMLFSAVQISTMDNAIEYVQQFHHNLNNNENNGADDIHDFFRFFISDEARIEVIDKELYNEAVESFKKFGDFYLEEKYNGSLNKYKVNLNFPGIFIKEEEEYSIDDVVEVDPKGHAILQQKSHKGGLLGQNSKFKVNKRQYKNNHKIDNDVRSNISMTNAAHDQDWYKNQILSSDIKKANELLPTMVTIRFIQRDKNGGSPVASTAIIGVKARLQYVESQDMMERIVMKNEDKNGLFNFIKATTGQLSFWKDFLFAIDKAKLDSIAVSRKGRSNPIWKLLERRAVKSKFRRWSGTVNDAVAITTILISKEEVDYLRKEEQIDLMKSKVAYPIINAYNLMCMVIVDETLEKAMFLYDDGTASYETLSFTRLERESDIKNYKNIISLLAKSR